ncbi:FtsX-like permease family protein [candidate division KSB1 bacterium]|nr:FtsX-like permease family protein [candidate division KSB1 bacterium]
MIIPKLAFRNILGAGIRTWLSVIVLSLSFVTIIWTQGLYKGMMEQVAQAMIEAECGGGQYWHHQYDPFDPISLPDAHAPIPISFQNAIQQQRATAILMTQGTIYPNGRMRSVTLKGIDPDQTLLSMPGALLKTGEPVIPALIGARMSKNTGLKTGDFVTLQWRDACGTFDAREIKIVAVIRTTVQTIDEGQIWLPLNRLQTMLQLPNQATLIVLGKGVAAFPAVTDWEFKDLDFLLRDIRKIVENKTVGASILYFILLLLAMLAIFDSQVLSIFRRRKEMGTLMALGMTRLSIIQLFTLEGALHGVLAALVAALYGIPLLTYSAKQGWAMPQATENMGIALGEKLFPTYSIGLVLGTTMLVLVITTIVSFLPTRKIVKVKPTDALRGKIA